MPKVKYLKKNIEFLIYFPNQKMNYKWILL